MNVEQLELKIDDFIVVLDVAQPYFEINTFMNNELSIDDLQKFEIQLNGFGLNKTDLWTIHSSNTLYANFKVSSGFMDQKMILQLPKDRIASDVGIYFTIVPHFIPGLILVNIKRTPILSGQTLSPTIQEVAGRYSFSYSLADILKYSLLEFPQLVNSFEVDSEHAGFKLDKPSLKLSTSPGYLVTSYALNVHFTILSEASVGQTAINGQISQSNLTIGTFTNIGTERLVFSEQLLSWSLSAQNKKYLKIGDLPINVNLSLIDTRSSLSYANFLIAALLVCKTNEYPNIFNAKDVNGNINLCGTCPKGATCSPTGAEAPSRVDGYYKSVDSNGVYSLQNVILLKLVK